MPMKKRTWIKWMVGVVVGIVAVTALWYVSWRRDPLRQLLYRTATAVSRYQSLEVAIEQASDDPERRRWSRTEIELVKVPGQGAHAIRKTDVRESEAADWTTADAWELWSNGVEEVRHRLDMPEIWVANRVLGCEMNRVRRFFALFELARPGLCFEKTMISFGGSSYLVDPGFMVMQEIRQNGGRYEGKASWLGRPASRVSWETPYFRTEMLIDDEFGLILSWRTWENGRLIGRTEITELRVNVPVDPSSYQMPDLSGKNVIRI